MNSISVTVSDMFDGLGRSNKFVQMQQLTNDDILILSYVAYSMSNIRTFNYLLIKTSTITCPMRHLQGLPRYRFNMADS